MTVVVDASVVVAALVVGGPAGEWSVDLMRGARLVAPHLMPAAVTNVLRRTAGQGEISHDVAALAVADLHDLAVDLVEFAPVADRVWALRSNLTAYDAWYVAVAEALDAPLATLDRRLARTPGPTCRFLSPSRPS